MTRSPAGRPRSLLLGYRLPTEPSRYRVSVWRRLRRIGATPLHRALFVVRDTSLNRLRLGDLAHDIENWGGLAWVFLATPLARVTTPAAPPRSRGRRRR